MNWYPFDQQKCAMVIAATEDLTKFIKLEKNTFLNLGPTELTQYYIQRIEMKNSVTNDDRQTVVLEVFLERRLLGTILTVFLPTILLNIIGHCTNYFKAFFMNVMVVNLTVTLVLTTMFVNISGKLPSTSYIKMIDVWLIFNLTIPFTEVLLHTYKVKF